MMTHIQVEAAVGAIASIVGTVATSALAISIVVVAVGLVRFNIIALHKLKQPPKSKKNPPVKPDHSKPPNRWIR